MLRNIRQMTALALLLAACVAHAESEFIRAPYESCKPYEGLIDNKDGTLTDPRNDLVWSRCDLGTRFVKGKGCVGKKLPSLSWVAAMKKAREDRTGNFNTWRLPTSQEIRSIVAPYGDCNRHGEYLKNDTAAVDLRMLIQEYYDSSHKIIQLEVRELRNYGMRFYVQNLRIGSTAAFPENSRSLDESDYRGGEFVRLVRKAGAEPDENLVKAQDLYTEYIDKVAAAAEQQRLQRNAQADQRAREEREKAKKLNSAKD